MHRKPRTPKARAFSALELLIVITLLITIVAIVAPSFTRSVERVSLTDAARTLGAAADQARAEAVREGRPIVLEAIAIKPDEFQLAVRAMTADDVSASNTSLPSTSRSPISDGLAFEADFDEASNTQIEAEQQRRFITTLPQGVWLRSYVRSDDFDADADYFAQDFEDSADPDITSETRDFIDDLADSETPPLVLAAFLPDGSAMATDTLELIAPAGRVIIRIPKWAGGVFDMAEPSAANGITGESGDESDEAEAPAERTEPASSDDESLLAPAPSRRER